MKFIPTTATAVEKLKRSAKNLRKETRTSLAVALESIAKSAGYDNWKHVTVCLEQTASQSKDDTNLPKVISDFLAHQLKDSPPSPEILDAIANGLVFAMDVKDAEELNLDRKSDLDECESVWPVAAADMWKVLVYTKNPENDKCLADFKQGDELLNTALDDLMNYRFFRYTGAEIPSSFEEAYALVFRRMYFPPAFVWVKGKFIDMDNVREIKLDDKVIYSSSPHGLSSQIISTETVTLADLAGSTLTSRMTRRGFIPKLSISKVASNLYDYHVTYEGQAMSSDIGFTSISEALYSASKMTGDIEGFQVDYQGIVVGIYAADSLLSSADSVERAALATVAPLMS